jgi:predicted ATP-grasp superfamily ATP-dependent carboligase
MKIFVYEYICGGGLVGRPLPESLAREGWAMLASIVEDFARIQHCTVLTTLDERFAGRPLETANVRQIASHRSGSTRVRQQIERETIAELATECDWSLIIAPETDGVLLDRVRWVEQAGGRLLGPNSIAVAIASDKIECARALHKANVPAVIGQRVDLDSFLRRGAQMRYPIVLKPRDGAGSHATFLIRDSVELASAVVRARVEAPVSEFIIEPYLHGVAASVSMLIGPHGVIALLPAEQLLSDDGRLRYCGGRIPLDPSLASRAVELATRAVAALPGLRGYVGVDLVLQSEISNLKSQISKADAVIEINPRLTTSYVGLRRLARANLAEQQLRGVAGDPWQTMEWQSETIGFSADGRIAYRVPDPGIPSC